MSPKYKNRNFHSFLGVKVGLGGLAHIQCCIFLVKESHCPSPDLSWKGLHKGVTNRRVVCCKAAMS